MSRLFACILFLFITTSVFAQMQKDMFSSDPKINPERSHDFLLEIDNADFFKNNEYVSELSKGYTLPGFWILPKLIYFPSKTTKVEFGWYLLQYFGANHYPAPSPAFLPDSVAMPYPGKFRNKAFLRIQWSPKPNFHIVLGSIYGGANHGLIEPLYQWERYFTANPEDGLQFLYKNHAFKLDVWINWQNFIFKNDPYLEQFTAGMTSEVTFTRPERSWQFSVPIQLLARHCGGQIDDTDFGVLTEYNAALGLKLVKNIDRKYLKSISASTYGLLYSKPGEKFSDLYSSGHGILSSIDIDASPFFGQLGYWSSNKFMSISGEPLLQSLSYMDNKTLYPERKVILVKVGIDQKICPGLSLGAYYEGYYSMGKQSESNYTYGVHMRFNQQFFLKKLKVID